MSQVKQILRMHAQGKGIKTIARELSISKNTVKGYIKKVELGELSIAQILEGEDLIVEAKLRSGNPSYKDVRYEYLKDRLEHYNKELKRTGVNRQLLWEEYCSGTPDPYSYTQFCYHMQQFRRSSSPTMVLDHHPGDKLYIDYAGKQLSYIDRETGEEISVQVFVACLPYSDHCFALAVPSQRIEDFIYALSCCLQDLGGVPRTLVPDNLKAAVVQANRYEPKINRALEDFANHYHCSVTPARPGKPRDKSLVENQVKLIYSRVYAKLRDHTFFDLHSLNVAIKEKTRAHNQTRMQNREYCREEKFLADEKRHLGPLPATAFEIKYYREHKVAKNNHIHLGIDKHYYSVPYTYIGMNVKVVYTRSLVKIYHQGTMIAAHPRNYRKGGYTTSKEHLCSHHRYYKERSPTYYMQRGHRHSETLYTYMETLFKQDKYPEQLYKTCDGILNLAKKTSIETFDKACQMALEHQNYSYRFLKRVLENRMTEYLEEPDEAPLPGHGNIRGAHTYK
ncbi:MAG TPA: IS21 family transposase [Arenibacter sp.]|nr:IS21 family transposase [Arenibacter sp.]